VKLAVASGKGGTGKTSVSASLVRAWPGPVAAVDLDVEEPNLHLLLHPEITGSYRAFQEVPKLREELCTHCGACSEICQFKAITQLGDVIVVFPEMCHGCGGCLAVCPEAALVTGARELGEVSWGTTGSAEFFQGVLRVGEAMGPPLMKRVMSHVAKAITDQNTDLIVDAPPGTSCPAVTAVGEADVILLVTEPTPFGLYDFRLALQAFSPMAKPMAAVINRAGVGDREVYRFCEEHDVPILAEIPYDRAVAEAYAQGHPAWDASDSLKALFKDLAKQIKALHQPGSAGERQVASG
jgi:MinD superfamily P-loop ATPase